VQGDLERDHHRAGLLLLRARPRLLRHHLQDPVHLEGVQRQPELQPRDLRQHPKLHGRADRSSEVRLVPAGLQLRHSGETNAYNYIISATSFVQKSLVRMSLVQKLLIEGHWFECH